MLPFTTESVRVRRWVRRCKFAICIIYSVVQNLGAWVDIDIEKGNVD